ncbi:invasion associated locus B family protein [Dinoroseobacter sp. S76]|uniref:invasion associated locus B family protein n=1 Tax=Dinoroseobacter sp. S76 TaxID=3415124 RepID=UPI003C7D86FB
MIRSPLSRLFAVALALTLAGPGAAQTAEGTAEAAPAELQPGQTYIRETLTDWSIRCIRGQGPQSEDSCQLYQLLRDQSDNPVSEFTLLPAPEGSNVGALITVITPLETVLTEGLILAVDGEALPPKPFVWCNRTGCFSRFGVSALEVDAMKGGAVATVSIVALARPDARVEVSASLRGFTAAFNKLSDEIKAAAPAAE